MSEGHANITIFGNIGRDAEPFTGGVRFPVAVTSRVKRDGQYIEHTDWYRVSAFGKRCESGAQFATKGTPVVVSGRLHLDLYKGKDGVEQRQLVLETSDYRLAGFNKAKESPQSGGLSLIHI